MTIGSIGGINPDGTGTPNALHSTDFMFKRDTGKMWASVKAVADRTPLVAEGDLAATLR
jgi:hypothetical protein